MGDGDFRSTERSATLDADDELRIEHVGPDGGVTVLKARCPVQAGEIVDARGHAPAGARRVPRRAGRRRARAGVLFSVHLKATMMKVSDPIIFGHAVRAYFADVFADARRGARRAPGRTPNNGLASILSAIESLPADEREAIEAAVARAYESGPALAMVDSDRGITNLHVPSDVIIDASMPAMIRASGRMWNADGEQQDTKAVIPDSSYAALYAETIAHCREHGAFDPATMGTTPNVGLMAQKAEEYGSHDKTFEIEAPGRCASSTAPARRCSSTTSSPATSGAPARPRTRRWPTGSGSRSSGARATGAPAVFWLDATRAHDAQVLAKVERELAELDTDGLRIEILPVAEATRFTLERAGARRGHDLGDRQRAARLPDRPVPDPRAGHEREDALDRAAHERRRPVRDRRGRLRAEARAAAGEGEPPALGLARASSSRSPSRSSSWPTRAATRAPASWPARSTRRPARCSRRAVAARGVGRARQPRQPLLPRALLGAAARGAGRRPGAGGRPSPRSPSGSPPEEEAIVAELAAVQGEPVDLDGYYAVDREKATAVMRPSATFNAAIASLGSVTGVPTTP